MAYWDARQIGDLQSLSSPAKFIRRQIRKRLWKVAARVIMHLAPVCLLVAFLIGRLGPEPAAASAVVLVFARLSP